MQPVPPQVSDPLPVLRALAAGATPAQVAGVSAQALEDEYRFAYEEILDGEHEVALERLQALVQQAPQEHRYVFAMAYCLQHLGQFDTAGRLYAHALMMDATNPLYAYRIGECLRALDCHAEAREAFETAQQLCDLSPGNEEVRVEAGRRLDEMAAQDH